MKKLKNSSFLWMVIIWGISCIFLAGIFVHAQEAQVIYNFIEITEDMPVFSTPDEGSETDITISKGEKVLVISQTADGWYQILYRGEILYINSQNDNMEEAEIPEEVIREIEQNKADQNLTQEEMKMLEEDIGENEKDTETFPQILLGAVFLIVLLSGIGYFYVSRKEKVEDAKKRKQAEVIDNDR